MWVVYKNEKYECSSILISERWFWELKNSYPNQIIEITRGGEKLKVFLKEVEDYSVWRNT
jgi:hypothetical protein